MLLALDVNEKTSSSPVDSVVRRSRPLEGLSLDEWFLCLMNCEPSHAGLPDFVKMLDGTLAIHWQIVVPTVSPDLGLQTCSR